METPRVFAPLLHPSRYKGAHGGRGSGKSHFFAELLVERAIMEPGLRAVCIREIQKSLEQSVKRLIEDKIQKFGVGHKFRVLDKEIETPGGGLIIFQGMQNHTAESIKSLEGYDLAWVEEAQSLSKTSLRLLRPTLRKPGSEIWFSWNPLKAEDPVDDLMRNNPPDDGSVICVEANWRDNPWFHGTAMEQERLSDFERYPEEYDHVWEGAYRTITEAVIFRNRVEFRAFETPANVDRFFFGADWGFATDPTVLIRAFVEDDCLYIDHEAFGHGVEIDETPALFDSIPGSRKWPIKADAARPETISYMARKGFRIDAADKWSGSVEDGIAHLKGFRKIIVHPRCPNIAQEFRLYSYKVDKASEDVLPIIVDKHNHGIDACIAHGELVTTSRGLVPVEAVQPGDMVLTRSGYRRVTHARMTSPAREVWEISAGGRTLFATPDHRVWTQARGFVRVDALRYDDELLIEVPSCRSDQKPQRSTGKFTAGIRKALGCPTGNTSSGHEPSRRTATCIATFGNSIWGRSPTGGTFTIGTETLPTTIYPIWSAFRRQIICEGILKRRPARNGEKVEGRRTLPPFGLSRWLGISLPKAEKSIKRSALFPTLRSFLRAKPVSTVAEFFLRGNWATPTASARMLVNQRGGEPRDAMMNLGNATYAEQPSSRTDTRRSALAPARVQCVRATRRTAPVYDLSVEGQPEFVASGILVHNCRYALDGYIKGRRKVIVPDGALARSAQRGAYL